MPFPSSIPSYTGFTSTHTLSQDQHASQHNAEQADIAAIATKIGTGASTPVSNAVLRGTGTGTSFWDRVHLATDVSGTLAAFNGGTGQTSLTSLPLVSPAITGGGSWTGAPVLSGPTIADYTNANHNHQNTAGGGTINGGTAIQSASITGDRLVSNTITSGKMSGINIWNYSNAIVGSPPAANSGQFYIQAGTNVVTFGSNAADIIFPTPFPNGVLSVVCINGDSNNTGGTNGLTVTQSNITGVSFRAQSANNGLQRVNWVAIGF